MWYIIAFMGVALFLTLLIGVYSAGQTKLKEQQSKAAAEKSYVEKYGCSMAEMQQRIRKSPAIKIVANHIKELPHYEKIRVLPQELQYDYNGSTILHFSSIGLSDIPQGCVGVFCRELEKELQTTTPYKWVQEDCRNYFVAEKPKEDVVKGW